MLSVRIGAKGAALAAVLLAFLWSIVPAAADPAAPEPPKRSALTAANAGNVRMERDRSVATIYVEADQIYPFVYAGKAEPISVGWLKVTDGVARIDLALMPAGEITIAVFGTNGDLLGWATTELAAAESNAPPEEPATGVGAGWIIGIAVVAGIGVVVGALLIARQRTRAAAELASDAEAEEPAEDPQTPAEADAQDPADETPADGAEPETLGGNAGPETPAEGGAEDPADEPAADAESGTQESDNQDRGRPA